MLGTGLQFVRGHGEDLFYNPVRARRSRHHHHQHYQQGTEWSRNSAGAGDSPAPAPAPREKAVVVVPEFRERENRARLEEEPSKAVASHALAPAPAAVTSPCNLHRFLESTTPSVPAQHLSKMRMKGWRTRDVEKTYFALGDLWESFKEWSAYGAGVPLVLNGSDSVVQYYVPYLSVLQLYGESSTPSINSRRAGEESDGDYYRDSSSDGSSDYEHEKGLKYSRAWSPNHLTSTSNLRMDRLSLKEKHVASQEGSSSDDGDSGSSQGHLLFEFLERDPPYIREPLADKVSVLARCFPELKTLRSCDLLPSSWISVAWYPIYRIPTGPTLRDLDACFLTFHYLSTPVIEGDKHGRYTKISGKKKHRKRGGDLYLKSCLNFYHIDSLSLPKSLQEIVQNLSNLDSVNVALKYGMEHEFVCCMTKPCNLRFFLLKLLILIC